MISPILLRAGALWAASKAKTRAAMRDADQSRIAAALDRFRYDPPAIGLWSLLKTALVGIVVLWVLSWTAWPFLKFRIREHFIAEFRVKQEAIQRQQAAADKAEISRLQSDLDEARSGSAAMLEAHKDELGFAVLEIKQLQRAVQAAGKCGWDAGTVNIINGKRPATPTKLKIIRRKS